MKLRHKNTGQTKHFKLRHVGKDIPVLVSDEDGACISDQDFGGTSDSNPARWQGVSCSDDELGQLHATDSAAFHRLASECYAPVDSVNVRDKKELIDFFRNLHKREDQQ